MWNELFENDVLHPHIRNYAEASIRFAEDQTHTRLFAGQMEVSLIMQENYRVGVHLAIFIVQLFPHRQFHDGHVIQTEFSEGSYTHQTINRLFDPNYNAVVSQATEYSILEYLAEEHEMTDILYDCFMDPDFRPMRFSYINDEEYIVDPNGNDDHHQWHEFQDQDADADADADTDSDADTEIAAIDMPPPPPPPALNNNHFEQIYHYYYNNNIYNDDDSDGDSDDDHSEDRDDWDDSDDMDDSESDSDDYNVRG